MSINICICGGGGLGHVIAGVAAHKGFNVSILTRHPDQWNPSLLIEDCRGNTFSGSLACVTANPAEVIPHSDIVLLCLPGFAIEEELLHIQPFLQEKTCIGSVVSCTGFFFTAYRILGKTASLFGFQRAPFIARVQTYGQKSTLVGIQKGITNSHRKHIKIRYFTTNSSRNVRYAGAYASSFSRSQPDQ